MMIGMDIISFDKYKVFLKYWRFCIDFLIIYVHRHVERLYSLFSFYVLDLPDNQKK
jgi:hypothetical protein